MESYTIDIHDAGKEMSALVGGKGANLGELSGIEGIPVPGGFCISTRAYERVVAGSSLVSALLDRLSLLKADARDRIAELCAEIRRVIEGLAIPGTIEEEIDRRLSGLGAGNAFAVRSSATAEDLPTASFAGQHDTYLNVTGKEAVLRQLGKCWASLFTERAVIYRLQNGFDHRKVRLAVIVQRMVFPQASGILFTADPVTSHRKVLSIDAGFGLGEALVSGLVNADNYKVRDGRITDKKIATKDRAVVALKHGGTRETEVEPGRQNKPVLSNAQILELEHLGRRIEEHFGQPQDIEWCLEDDAFYIVQSRPITTLYPIPERPGGHPGDQKSHVYLSVAHQQMMTDPMKPLGLSMWQAIAARPMFEAGGRLFVDISPQLATVAGRNMLLTAMGQHDPLIKDALLTVIERGDPISLQPETPGDAVSGPGNKGMPPAGFPPPVENDPAIVGELIRSSQAALEELKQNIRDKSGPELFDFILEDIERSKPALTDPRSMGVVMAAMKAASWINEKMKTWLAEENVGDVLSQSVPNNVTSEMGLALLDVADVIRPFPQVVDYLQRAKDGDFPDGLDRLPGGREARDAIVAYLDRYGMRCVGEIDITRTRWSENPATLFPLILSNIRNFEPGAGKRKFEQGRQEALEKEQDLLDRLRQMPDGKQKAEETKRMIDVLRNFSGYREYPKYSIVSRFFVYKQALLKEAEQLEQAGVFAGREEMYYLSFEEFREVVRNHKLDRRLIIHRKQVHQWHEKLTPPRVITSDGEIIVGKYDREGLPAAALVGLAVSSGVIEGRARVILDMEGANLENGDILVTRFTDPSWTPLFVSIQGLVTEVGGLMTHGAVIAREYGLPAVVGVENATGRIRDGQRIRVNGTQGYVEILPEGG